MSEPTVETIRNPYPGLRPFRSDEKHLFFGREQQVDRMVEKLAAHHFLGVVGGSGSGKSSLVNCGLRPALHRGNMASAGAAWRMAQLRPGNDPIGALARALAAPGVLFDEPMTGALSGEALVESTLRLGSLGLIDMVEQADLPSGTQVLVVADQFEELFRFRSLVRGASRDGFGAAEDGVAFVRLLLEAAAQTTVPIYVVLTMRSDFLGDCDQFHGLPEAINEGQYLVPRLTRNEIRAAITGPAAVRGATLSPVLVTRLLNDVGDNPDQLSILQHALNRTWARWENEGGSKALDLPHYEAIGTMTHALDQHAERAYAELTTPRQQQICGKLFKALTDKATDPRGVRRPTTLGTLCSLADATAPEVTEVIDVFRKPSRSFLMPPAAEPLRAETVIDISHESLMRVWERLKGWAEEEARSASNYRRLAETAELHLAEKANLLRDPELQLAVDWQTHERPNEVWAAQYRPDFQPAMQFLRESAAARDVELAAERRKRHRRRGIIGVSMVVMFLFGGWSYLQEVRAKKSEAKARDSQTKAETEKAKAETEKAKAETEKAKAVAAETKALDARREAVEDRDRADLERARAYSRQLGVEAMMELTTDPRLALDKARQAVRIDPGNLLADTTLRRAIGAYVPSIKYEHVQRSRNPNDTGEFILPFSLASGSFGPNGDRIVVATEKGAEIHPVAPGGRRVELNGHTDIVGSASFSPDGRMVVTTSGDKTARLWDAASGRLLHTLPHAAPVNSAVFDANGKSLLVTAADRSDDSSRGEVILWDIRTGERKVQESMAYSGEDARYAAFSPDGRWIVSLSQPSIGRGGKATVWHVASGKQEKQLELSRDESRTQLHCIELVDVKTGITYSPDGKTFAVLDGEGRVTLFDAATLQAKPRQLPSERRFCSLAWSHDSSRIAGALDDGAAKVWDARDASLVHEVPRRSDLVVSVAFSPDPRRTLLTASSDKTVRLWASPPGVGGKSDGRTKDDRGLIQIAVLRGHKEIVSSALFSPDGRYILSSADDGTARIWKLSSEGELRFSAKGLSIAQAVLTDNGQIVTMIARAGSARQAIWQIRVVDLRGHGELGGGIVKSDLPDKFTPFSPPSLLMGGAQVLLRGGDGGVGIWDVEAARFRLNPTRGGDARAGQQVHLVSSTGTSFAIFEHGKLIALNSRAGSNLVASDPARFRFQYDEKSKCEPAALSQEGGQIALRCKESKRIHNIKVGVPGRELPDRFRLDFQYAVQGASFDPTGSHLAVVLENDTVHVVKLSGKRGHEVATLTGHTKTVTNVQFNRTGAMLVTSSEDGAVRVWDAGSGRLLASVFPTQTPIAVAFAQDDRRILIQMEASLAIWDCPVCGSTKDILAEADRLLGTASRPRDRASAANETARQAAP